MGIRALHTGAIDQHIGVMTTITVAVELQDSSEFARGVFWRLRALVSSPDGWLVGRLVGRGIGRARSMGYR